MKLLSTYGQFRGGGPLSFLAFVLIPIFSFTLGWILATSNTPQHGTTFVNEDATILTNDGLETIDVSLLRDAMDIVRKKYISPDEIDTEEIKYGIVRGLIWSLDDPYSEFMSPEESADFENDLNGNLEGIGAELTVKDGMIVVVSPLRDSPAEAAGLLPNDIVIKVNEEEASGKEFLNVVKRIRGKKGTAVTLTVFRPETGKEEEIVIVRDKIRIETVQITWDENIAIIELSQFGTNTKEEFFAALEEAQAKNAQGIILDLRFNSGGFLEKAVDVVSAFHQSGKVVIQKGRPPKSDAIYTTGNVKTGLPLVVLQNNGSASASEIVSGAIQDLGRGTVVGEQSFGKGTVQELVPMKNGASLRITVAKWLTPNGRDIGEVGIDPDILVERTTEDYENELDPQMDVALRLLRGEELEKLKEEFAREGEDMLSDLKEEESAEEETEEETEE